MKSSKLPSKSQSKTWILNEFFVQLPSVRHVCIFPQWDTQHFSFVLLGVYTIIATVTTVTWKLLKNYFNVDNDDFQSLAQAYLEKNFQVLPTGVKPVRSPSY